MLTKLLKAELNAQRRAAGLPALGVDRPRLASRSVKSGQVVSAQDDRNAQRRANFYARLSGKQKAQLTLYTA